MEPLARPSAEHRHQHKLTLSFRSHLHHDRHTRLGWGLTKSTTCHRPVTGNKECRSQSIVFAVAYQQVKTVHHFCAKSFWTNCLSRSWNTAKSVLPILALEQQSVEGQEISEDAREFDQAYRSECETTHAYNRVFVWCGDCCVVSWAHIADVSFRPWAHPSCPIQIIRRIPRSSEVDPDSISARLEQIQSFVA